MRGLTDLTAGLVGRRDPAQPLLTLLDGPARVELSGATVANWVAKTANLLVDGWDAPGRVGLVPALHWQAVCALLGAVTSGAAVTVAPSGSALAGVDVAVVTEPQAAAAIASGAGTLVLSGHPMGLPSPTLPSGAEDFGREVLAHGDTWTGPVPAAADLTVDGQPLGAVPDLDIGCSDRVAVGIDVRGGTGLRLLLGVLRAGAAVVLLPRPQSLDLARIAVAEGLTASVGVEVPGVRPARARAD